MNANYIREDLDCDVEQLFKDLKLLGKELDDITLLQMLNSTWRPSKVAAWIIGLCQRRDLEEELFTYLENRPMYCEHVIFAIAILNSEKCSHEIVKYLDTFLQQIPDDVTALLRTETLAWHWAMAALQYLDKMNGTNFRIEFDPKGTRWTNYMDSVKIKFPQIKNLEGMFKYSERLTEKFDSAMNMVVKYKSK